MGPTQHTAVNVTLAGHLWEALEFLKMSFDEDKNGGLAGEGRQPNRQGMETGLWEERGARGLAGCEGEACKGPDGTVTSVVCLQGTLLFSPENLRAEQAQSHPDIPTDMN